MIDKQGQKANRNGKWLENEVEQIIKNNGYASTLHSKIGTKFGNQIISNSPKGFLLKHVPFINAYGGNSRSEFVLKPANKDPIRIECKYQKVSGSVDEKLFFLVANVYKFEEKKVIVVMECKGARKEARNFVKASAKNAKLINKKVMVFTLNQFRAWANSTL